MATKQATQVQIMQVWGVENGQVTLTLKPTWTEIPPSDPTLGHFEFRQDIGGTTLLALRQRSGYGWSYFEIYRLMADGKTKELRRGSGGLSDTLTLTMPVADMPQADRVKFKVEDK